MTPKSPRAALEPERVAMPTRRSKRAKHPIVIIGNAIFTIILLLTLASAAWCSGANRNSMPPGRSRRTRSSIFRAAACATSPRCCAREGVISDPWVFIGGALALKAPRRGSEIRRISIRQTRQHARRRRDHHRGQGRPASIDARRRPDLRADRGAASGERRARPETSARFRARARCCRNPTNSRAA